MIHPTAVIHPQARVPSDTQVGPYCVIDADVEIGPECQLGPHVYLTGKTRIGARNKFHAGAVIGDWPQDLRFSGAPTGVLIGDDNTFREHVTVHRSNNPDEPTRIGSRNLLMANSHVGHNTVIEDSVIVANGALLAGHVTVGSSVFISGNCMVHQFARIGMLALMQGGSGVSKDLPPFTIATGNNTICGLNTIGLRRAGLSSEERLELRRLYHALFRTSLPFRQAFESARSQFTSERARTLLDFVATARCGVCFDAHRGKELNSAKEPGDNC